MKTKFLNAKVAVLEHTIYFVYSKLDRSESTTASTSDKVSHTNSTSSSTANSTSNPRSSLPIILLHGAIVSHYYWMPTAHELAKTQDVYALDFPGHGHSSKPSHTLGVIEQADVTAAWLDVMGFEKAVIAANSYACEIAVEMAIRYPQKVDSLILTAPASDPAEPTVHQQGIRLIRDAVSERITMGFVLIYDAFLIGIKRCLETCQIMVDYDYLPRLPLVQQPSIVVRGSKDTVATQAWVAKVASLLPHGKLEVIPNGPHDINYSTPKRLSEIINNFVEQRISNTL